MYYSKVPLNDGPIIRQPANYDHFSWSQIFPYRPAITTPFSGPNDMFIAVLGSTNETTFTVVKIPHLLFITITNAILFH